AARSSSAGIPRRGFPAPARREEDTSMSCLKPEGAQPAASGRDGLDHNPASLMQPRAPHATPKDLRNGARVKANGVAPRGVYLPNYNILTPHMRSPNYVQMSTAAAITLGIMSGRMYRCSC